MLVNKASSPYDLSVIVPVSKMEGRLSLLFSWIPDALANRVKVVLVHDVRDRATGQELQEFVAKQGSNSLVLIEDYFGAPGRARNAGLNYVESQWVAFWDSDDLPHVKVVTSQIKFAKASNKKVLVGAFEIVDVSAPKESEKYYFKGPELTWINQLPAKPGLWRFVIDKSLLEGEVFSNLKMGEDQLLIQELLQNINDFYFYNEIAYSYFVGNDFQATRNKEALRDLKQLALISYELYARSNSKIKKLLVPYLSRQIFSNFKYLGIRSGVSLIFLILRDFGVRNFIGFVSRSSAKIVVNAMVKL